MDFDLEAFLQALRNLSMFDYVCLAVLLLSAGVGAWRGMVSELIAILGWAVALLAAWRFGSLGSQIFSGIIEDPLWQQVAGFVLLFMLVLILSNLLRVVLKQFLRLVGLRSLDRFLGMLFGLARGAALVLVFVLLGGLTELSAQSWWQEAAMSDFLEQVVLDLRAWMPSQVAAQLRFG